jgi:predicted choloylglycine hydrolase
MNGVRVLTLSGNAQKRGMTHGKLLEKEIQKIVKEYVKGFLFKYMGGRSIVLAVAESAEAEMSKETKTELKALAKGAGVSYESILILNAHVDSMALACSTIAVSAKAVADKKPLLARNLDWPAPAGLNDMAVLTIVRPAEGNAYANFTFPGFIGILTGLNSTGLSVSMNVSSTKDGSRLCLPTPLLLRQALHQSSTVDTFVSHLKKAKRCSGFIITALDKQGNGRAIEFTAGQAALRKPDHEVLLSTNHFRLKTMQKLQSGSTKNSKNRLEALTNSCTYMEGTPLTASDLKTALHTEPVLNKKTLMSVLVSPVDAVFQVWQRGAPKGQFATVDIGKILSGATPISEHTPLNPTQLRDLN